MTSERFPYLRSAPEGYCEICHRAADALTEITIRPSEQVVVHAVRNGKPIKTTRWTMRRTVMACGRHGAGVGGPVVTPCTTMLHGTTTLRPQPERLFDQVPYSTRAGRFG